VPPRFTHFTIAVVLAVALTLAGAPGMAAADPGAQGIAGRLTLFGPAAQGRLDASTPNVTYAFDARAGQPISLRSVAYDAALLLDLTLTGPDGAVLARGITTTDPGIRVIDAFTPPVDGTYYATVSALNGSAGAFDLALLGGYADLVVADDFSSADDALHLSWTPFVSIDAAADVVNGALGIQVINEGRLGFFEPDGWTAYRDLYIQADFTIEESPGYHEYGFALRNAPGADSFYTVLFSSEGDWALFFFDGAWHVVQDWTYSPAIDGADTAPCISVFVEDSTFRVYFNGHEVGTITDVQLFAREGGFGIVAATSPDEQGVLVASVDNLTVTTPATPYAALASLPPGSTTVTTP